MNTIYLQGSEDVSRAASSISESADTMRRAASSIDESLDRNQRFMDDWLVRFQDVLKEHSEKE